MTPGHTDHPEKVPHADSPGPGYEPRDANVSRLLLFGAGLVVFLIAVELAMLGFYRVFETESRYQRPRPVRPTSPENLYQQLRVLRGAEEVALHSYGWVDRRKGIVRIPIERAIELVAEKGVPFGKGPKSELEILSHGGTPARGKDEEDKARDTKNPTSDTGSKTPAERTGPKP